MFFGPQSHPANHTQYDLYHDVLLHDDDDDGNGGTKGEEEEEPPPG